MTEKYMSLPEIHTLERHRKLLICVQSIRSGNWKGEVRQILWPLLPFITFFKETVTHEDSQSPFRSTWDRTDELPAGNSFICLPVLVNYLTPSGLLRRVLFWFNLAGCSDQKRPFLLPTVSGLFSLLFHTLPASEVLCQMIKIIVLSGPHMETGRNFI